MLASLPPFTFWSSAVPGNGRPIIGCLSGLDPKGGLPPFSLAALTGDECADCAEFGAWTCLLGGTGGTGMRLETIHRCSIMVSKSGT